MKKKILITIIIFVIIIIVAIGYVLVKDFNEEGKFEQEMMEISELLDKDEIDFNELDKKLTNTITTGDYKIIEEAFKHYLKDSLDNSNQIITIFNNEKISDIVTANNYNNDGPDFINTKQYIKETKEKLDNCKNKYYEFLTEEKAMSYIKDTDLDKYYIDFYRENLIGEVLAEYEDKTVETTVNEAINLLDNSEKIIDFLISNKNNWQINGENIEFNNDKLIDDYNSMIDSLKSEITK